MKQAPLALTLTANHLGRDFVVGDIHGHFSALETLLRQVDFRPDVDRLFSVGDLIDRGPESLRATEFLDQEWFYAVRGNHEDILLAALAGDHRQFELWQQVGGRWAQFADPQQLERLASQLSALPYVMEIESNAGKIGIVHADVPTDMPWPELFQRLQQGRLDKKMLQYLIWSRERMRRLHVSRLNPGLISGNHIAGVHCVYLGHNRVERVERLGNLVFLETGAYCGGHLSLVNLATGDISNVHIPLTEREY